MVFGGFLNQTTSTPVIRCIFEISEMTTHDNHAPAIIDGLLSFDFAYGRAELVTLAPGFRAIGSEINISIHINF